MAGLTGKTIASTYDSLLRTLADGGITATLQVVEDGAGDNTCLQLSTKQFLVKSETDIDATFDVQNSSGHQLFTVDTVSSPEEVVINEGGLATVDFRVEGSSAANALFVDGTNGNVGIGTASPESALHIHTADNTTIDTVVDGSNSNTHADYGLLIRNASDTQYSFAGIAFDVTSEIDANSTAASIAAVSMNTDSTAHDASLTFNTNDAGDNALYERMRITNAGNVGIGTNSPARTLTVAAPTTPVIELKSTTTSTTAGLDIGAIEWSHSDANADANNLILAKILVEGNEVTGADDSPSSMSFWVVKDGTDTLSHVMEFTKDLNVGIGTDGPQALLELDQGAADTKIIKLVNSDVAHGITDHCETDCFCFFDKAVDAAGGVQITGLNDPDGPGYAAINLRAMLGTAALTTKSTSGYGAIRMLTYIKAGTGTAAMTSDGNLLSIEDGNTVRHIFDKEGQMHSSVAPTTSGMDSYDDAQLVRAHALSSFPNGIIESKFDEFIKYNHEKLAELKLVGREEDGTPNHFVNVTKMQQLHNGAIWQQYTEIQKMKELMYETMVELMGKEEANKKLDSHDIKLLDKGILS